MRPSLRYVSYLLLIGSLAPSSKAQHMNSPDAPCREPASTVEERQCFVDALSTADKKLSQVYTRVLEILEPDEQAALRATQKIWIEFRDSNCAAERSLYNGGTATSTVYAACMEAETRQRIAELKTMYNWRAVKVGKTIE